MNAEHRIRLIRVIEKIEKNPKFSKKIGIKDKTKEKLQDYYVSYNFSGDGNGKILRGKSYQRTSDSCAKAAFCRLRSCVADGTGRI